MLWEFRRGADYLPKRRRNYHNYVVEALVHQVIC